MENAKNSQIFITSHHTNLISNSVFRPDQINLITFLNTLGSNVKRLSQFKPREAQNLEKCIWVVCSRVYQYMKKYRIDKTKNIGNVIFVVEGGRPETGGTELRLLKKYSQIFWDMKFRN